MQKFLENISDNIRVDIKLEGIYATTSIVAVSFASIMIARYKYQKVVAD